MNSGGRILKGFCCHTGVCDQSWTTLELLRITQASDVPCRRQVPVLISCHLQCKAASATAQCSVPFPRAIVHAAMDDSDILYATWKLHHSIGVCEQPEAGCVTQYYSSFWHTMLAAGFL